MGRKEGEDVLEGGDGNENEEILGGIHGEVDDGDVVGGMGPGPECAGGIAGGGGELEEGNGVGDAVVVFSAIAIDAADELVDGAGGGEAESMAGLPAEIGPGLFAVSKQAESGSVRRVVRRGADVEQTVLCERKRVLQPGRGGDDAREESRCLQHE